MNAVKKLSALLLALTAALCLTAAASADRRHGQAQSKRCCHSSHTHPPYIGHICSSPCKKIRSAALHLLYPLVPYNPTTKM